MALQLGLRRSTLQRDLEHKSGRITRLALRVLIGKSGADVVVRIQTHDIRFQYEIEGRKQFVPRHVQADPGGTNRLRGRVNFGSMLQGGHQRVLQLHVDTCGARLIERNKFGMGVRHQIRRIRECPQASLNILDVRRRTD